VFLQQIEYTSTIIFLSTNRIGSFDPAMLSRIHLPIKYGKLSDSQQQAIWRSRLGKKLPLEDEQLKMLVEAGQNFSGRDIRNIVQMATHLGETGGGTNDGEKGENNPAHNEDTKRARFQCLLDLVMIRHGNILNCMGDDADDIDEAIDELKMT